MVRHIAVYPTVMINEFPHWFPLKELPAAALKEDRWCFCPAGDPLLHSMMFYKCKQSSYSFPATGVLWGYKVQLRESHLARSKDWKSKKYTEIQFGASNSSFLGERISAVLKILMDVLHHHLAPSSAQMSKSSALRSDLFLLCFDSCCLTFWKMEMLFSCKHLTLSTAFVRLQAV